MSEELKKAYGRMSTEQLEELLRLDVLTDDGLDDDTVFLILEILEEREKAAGTFADDSEQMWDSFQKNYLPLVGSASLYEEDEVAAPAEEITEERFVGSSPAAELTASRKRRRSVRPMLRAACLLLVGVLLTAAITATARAAGYDIWSVFARWNDESFSFAASSSFEPEVNGIPYSANFQGDYGSLQEALEVHGVTEQLAPTWLPDGYALDDVTVTSGISQTSFVATYITDSGTLVRIIVDRHNTPDAGFAIYEKDDGEVEVYTVNGIDHFIFSNLKHTQIVWFADNYECSVSGVFSFDEAQRIVDSIYGG